MDVESISTTVIGLVICGAIIAAFILQRRWLRTTWERGMQAYERGDTAEVEKAFRYLVRKAPSWAAARRMLARALTATGAFKEAEKELRFALELEPRNPEAHVDLAIFLANVLPRREEEAVALLEKAVEQSPDLRMALSTLPQLKTLRENPRFCVLAGLPEPVISAARLN